MQTQSAQHRILLPDDALPRYWYNIAADMTNLAEPSLHPDTRKPVTGADLSHLFARGLVEQELSGERYIDIPQPLRERLHAMRPSPLFRARALEKELDTPARLYYKCGGDHPSGTALINTALAQAYYSRESGASGLVSECGDAGWGVAVAAAAQAFGLGCDLFLDGAAIGRNQQILMQIYGARVHLCPSAETAAGRAYAAAHPGQPADLPQAVAEAVETALSDPNLAYVPCRTRGFVLLHQTVIGLEAKIQLEKLDEFPDVVVAGGNGADFAGLAFPFLQEKLAGRSRSVFVLAEPAGSPKLTQGVYAYDVDDSIPGLPLSKMYTLGREVRTEEPFARELWYASISPIVSQLYCDGYIEAAAVRPSEAFEAACLLARTEAVLPSVSAAHAVSRAVAEARLCRETGEARAILFSVSGNSYLDLTAYAQYFAGQTRDAYPTLQNDVAKGFAELPTL